MSLRLAVDFDGTLVDGAPRQAVRPDAVMALRAIKKAGHKLVLFSCRNNPVDELSGDLSPEDEAANYWASGDAPQRQRDAWERFTSMRDTLRQAGLWSLFDEIWQRPGKPVAELYVDDLSEKPDWQTLATELTGGAR